MTITEVNLHRIALQNKRAELTYRCRRVLIVESNADEMDQTQGAQQRDLAIGGFDREAKLLHDVRSALDRIEAGTYGTCIDCENEISRKRLKAVPWAAACIVCQEAADSCTGPQWSAGEGPMASAA